MTRLGLVLCGAALATGCANSQKVVIQHGYPGIAPAPSSFKPKQPAPLSVPRESPTGPPDDSPSKPLEAADINLRSPMSAPHG